MSSDLNILLAVDLGMKAGLAWFDAEGHLLRARATHFPDRAALKKALPRIWREIPGLTHVVLEGGGSLAEIWQKCAERFKLDARVVSAEDWRQGTLTPSQRKNGQTAKAAACELALQIARRDGCPPCRQYLDDAAEAILLGKWHYQKLSMGK